MSAMIRVGFDVQKAHHILRDFLKNNVEICEITTEDYEKVCELRSSGNARSGYPSFYDCLYHAVALNREATFITLDHKHLVKVEKFGGAKHLNEI